MKYKVFWCKVNKYYTDKWLKSDYLKWKSGIFIATCVVTDQAKKRWLKFIKNIFIKNELDIYSWDKIFISWCWAFKNWFPQENFFELYPDLLVYKKYIEVLAEDPENTLPDNKILSNNISENINNTLISKQKLNKLGQIYTKKFILIQSWCDSFCSFCLTVKKRGRHFYRSKEDIRDEILDFEKKDGKEVVLTWVNLSAWGLNSTNDIGQSRFAELLEYLLENTNIKRIRISSIWPEFIDEKSIKIFANKRIYPHFHFSIQSASTSILKAMLRHYDWKYIKNLLEKIRNIKREDGIDISIWADIIVGFPAETDDDFEETLNLIRDFNITKVHAFPFSAHELGETIPAWFFKNQIDIKIKKLRMMRLINLWDNIRKDFIERNIWQVFEVLIESVKDTKWKWWTQNYIETNQDNFEIIKWTIWKNQIVIWKLIR